MNWYLEVLKKIRPQTPRSLFRKESSQLAPEAEILWSHQTEI